MKKLIPFLLAILLSACSLARVPLTLLPATPTPTAAPEYPQQCGWQWATQALPDLSAQVEQAIQAGVQPQARAYAQAYGENCLNADGQVAYFATLETDFYVTLKVNDLNDRADLGELLDLTLAVLDGFPNDQNPGPQNGYARVTFEHGQDQLNLWFQLTLADEYRRQGLRGTELLDALAARP